MSTTWYNRGNLFAPHITPVLLDMHFDVDATNSNGLGISNLRGPGILNVFMHTTQTPGSNNGRLNPNPAAGYILVQLKDNYSRFFSHTAGFVAPNSGSDLLIASAGLSIGAVYVISVLGTTTQLQWQHLGVPPGATAAVGMAFVALATSATGTGAVQLPATAGSGIDHVELVGKPNESLASQPVADAKGICPWLIFKCMGKSVAMGAYTPAGTVAAPTFTGESYTPSGSVAAPSFTGALSPLNDLYLATPTFSGTGLTAAGQDITTTDNQTMTANQCAGMWLIPATGSSAPMLILSNTAVAGAPAVFTVQGTAATDPGAYKVVSSPVPIGSISAPAFTGNAHTLAGTNSAPAFTGSPAELTGTATDIVATPANGTNIHLELYLSQSSVTTTGE